MSDPMDQIADMYEASIARYQRQLDTAIAESLRLSEENSRLRRDVAQVLDLLRNRAPHHAEAKMVLDYALTFASFADLDRK